MKGSDFNDVSCSQLSVLGYKEMGNMKPGSAI